MLYTYTIQNYDCIKYNQPDELNRVTAIINVSIRIYEAKGYESYITVRQHNIWWLKKGVEKMFPGGHPSRYILSRPDAAKLR